MSLLEKMSDEPPLPCGSIKLSCESGIFDRRANYSFRAARQMSPQLVVRVLGRP